MILKVTSIQNVDLTQMVEAKFSQRYVGCIVLTHDHKILLQQRGADWSSFPEFLSEFGGCIKSDETPMQALIRELKEELGAQIKEEDVVSLGAITEEITNHSELIYFYFWEDKHQTITGCYEGKAKYFDNLETVLTHPKVMDSVVWGLYECQNRQLL